VLFALKETGCSLHDSMYDSMTNDKSVAGTVRVVLWIDKTNPDKASLERFAAFNQGVKQEEVYAPQMFLLDPQGRISAEVGYGQEAKIKNEAAKVNELTAWQASAAKQIARAGKDAAAGRFAAALASIEKIEQQDRSVTAAITSALKGEASPPTSPQTRAPAKKSSASENAAPASASPAGKELPPGRYFPDLLKTKREAYEKLASARLADARTKAEAKDVAAARKLLTPMVADASDLSSVAEAKQLLEGFQGSSQPQRKN